MSAYREIGDDEDISSIYVYQSSMRAWHWLNAVAVVVLTVTGFVIGTPLPSYTGDPSSVYVMGWIRMAHLAAGHIFAALWLLRLWCAVTGNRFARQLFVPPVWRKTWTDGLAYQLAWNLLLVSKAKRYSGLNPLAHVTMLVAFVLPSILLLITGYAMYAEVAGHESLLYALFGWTSHITANTIDLHTIHRICMWVVVCFVLLHIYSAVREDIVSRQSMVSTMLSGYRLFKRD
jgi:Ni/Fe-hydrogenase 1 B-type cytochrome subunit